MTTEQEPGAASRGVLLLVVGDRETGPWSYTWRIWANGTSFYVKPRTSAFSAMKVSLHGPDSRPHIGPPGNKIEVIGALVPDNVAGMRVGSWPEKGWFPGRQVAPGVRHVVRLRFPWTLFGRGRPSAPNPGLLRRQYAGLVAPPPPSMNVVDVDFYVSDRGPHWPNERKARRDNACLGPLVNAAGQHLTAVSTKRSPFTVPGPDDLVRPAPEPHDAVRGLGMTSDPSGFLWVCEQWLSRRELDRAAG